ncbi:hypothetical protein PC116_g16377 [Phytophthora cactorum]|uniref:Uncharacterized protein n=1 Tax=Phytophthora cactorum TaxID=29920 RepID=A0A8T1D2A9_9STRA|nr:hypothetical protein PC112_g12548 [Phytophthora cactorum]KAG2820726.1 hypothetical protein PC111_g11334 [Phytophthora cactorum]KAG2854763.1 hypothetical protein PC113_g13032 [Phytophthora cactorum]KAG2900334.1 hypothetical protein PC114_g13605 [Phytophthora cactorum]KAG2913528.1 hypothetical protein PC115_g12001 [Phytophthora cactorum]
MNQFGTGATRSNRNSKSCLKTLGPQCRGTWGSLFRRHAPYHAVVDACQRPLMACAACTRPNPVSRRSLFAICCGCFLVCDSQTGTAKLQD